MEALKIFEVIVRALVALGGPIKKAIEVFAGRDVEKALSEMREAYAKLKDSPDLPERFKSALDERIDALPDDEEPDSIETDDDP